MKTSCALAVLGAAGLLWALSACSTSTDGPPPGYTIELSGACDQAERVGGFVVEVQEGVSIVAGDVADGVVPAEVREVVDSDQGCRLLRRNNPFCDPPCASLDTCDFDGRCIPYPVNQDLGVVDITGLEKAVSMEPIPPSNSYFDTQLPHPVFQPGAEIFLRSTGGEVEAIALDGYGVDDLLLPEDTVWSVEEGVDVSIDWPAGSVEAALIRLDLNIDQHGNTPITLSCEFPDTGSAVVPSRFVDALFSAGVSGFPTGYLRRFVGDSVDLSVGCVDFLISSPRDADVSVEGHFPCFSTDDCPQGMTCDVPINTCI
jgi:hypothetical protein